MLCVSQNEIQHHSLLTAQPSHDHIQTTTTVRFLYLILLVLVIWRRRRRRRWHEWRPTSLRSGELLLLLHRILRLNIAELQCIDHGSCLVNNVHLKGWQIVLLLSKVICLRTFRTTLFFCGQMGTLLSSLAHEMHSSGYEYKIMWMFERRTTMTTGSGGPSRLDLDHQRKCSKQLWARERTPKKVNSLQYFQGFFVLPPQIYSF